MLSVVAYFLFPLWSMSKQNPDTKINNKEIHLFLRVAISLRQSWKINVKTDDHYFKSPFTEKRLIFNPVYCANEKTVQSFVYQGKWYQATDLFG